MTEQNIADLIGKIETLHRSYLDWRDHTPNMNRDGAECKAYHDWYDAAYVLFSSMVGLKGTRDFDIFTNAKKDGNCFDLEHVYHSISASYEVLMNQAKTIETQGKIIYGNKNKSALRCLTLAMVA